MFKGYFISFPIDESIALLSASSSVTIGRHNISDITKDNFGAVLISDDVITWVPPAPKTKSDEVRNQLNTTDKALNVINTAIYSVIK